MHSTYYCYYYYSYYSPILIISRELADLITDLPLISNFLLCSDKCFVGLFQYRYFDSDVTFIKLLKCLPLQ